MNFSNLVKGRFAPIIALCGWWSTFHVLPSALHEQRSIFFAFVIARIRMVFWKKLWNRFAPP